MNNFAQFLSVDVYAYFLVFARIVTVFLFLPGFGERFVVPRLRVLLTLVVTLVMTPLVSEYLPPLSLTVTSFVLILLGEAAIGLFLGFLTRLFIYALETAGAIISQVTGLSNAMVSSPITAQQAAILSGFLAITGVMLIFALDLHHYFIMGIMRTYQVFTPGDMPPLTDFSTKFIEFVSLMFKIGVSFSAPFLVANLVFFVGMGLLSRLVTQIQIFFVAMPLQIMIGIAILYISMTSLFVWYTQEISTVLPSIWGF